MKKWLTKYAKLRKSATETGLRGQGIGHWVVVEGFVNERVGYGIVQVYNPFPNRIELYEYKTFIESCRNPYGAMMEA